MCTTLEFVRVGTLKLDLPDGDQRRKWFSCGGRNAVRMAEDRRGEYILSNSDEVIIDDQRQSDGGQRRLIFQGILRCGIYMAVYGLAGRNGWPKETQKG
jgi:hypothetical protein